MTKDSDVNPFEEELRADSYTGHLETKEVQLDAEHWYDDPEEWWRDSSNYQRQAMLVSAGITDMNLASFEYDDLSEDIQRQLAEDSIKYSPESKAKEEGTSDGAKKGWLTRKRGGSSAEEPRMETKKNPYDDDSNIKSGIDYDDEEVSDSQSDQDYYDGITQNTMETLQQSTVNGFPFFAYIGQPQQIFKDGKGGVVLYGMKRNPNSVRKVDIMYDEGADTYSVRFVSNRGKVKGEYSDIYFDQLSNIIVGKKGLGVESKASEDYREYEDLFWDQDTGEILSKDDWGDRFNFGLTYVGKGGDNAYPLKESKASESLDYFDKKDIIDDSPMEEQLYDVLWAEHDNGDNGKDLYPSIRDDFCRGGMNIESLVSPVQSQRSKNAIASLLRWADGVFKANESKATEVRHLSSKQKSLIKNWVEQNIDSLTIFVTQEDLPYELLQEIESNRDYETLYSDITRYASDVVNGSESKASENFTFYEDASHGWLEVPKSLLKELGIADQISSYSYQSGDMAYLEEDADLSLFISKYGNVNTNNPQDGKHIRNYGSYVGESVAWINASFNRKLDALESLGIKQGDAVRLASVAYEDLSEDLKKDLELPYTEEDAENEQELSAQYAEQDDVDYNNIGESRTARTKYECEHCNCGFKSNESLSIHYNQIHAVAPAPIEGYENWKDVADDLYEKEQSKRKKGGEAFHSTGNTDFIDYTTIDEDEIATCDLCGKTWDMNDGYTKVDDIENHLSLVHDKAFESKANEDRVLNEDIPQNHCPECGSYKTSYDTDEKMNVCDNCGNRFEYKSSESLQSTLNKGFDNAMVMDQDDMYRCRECGQLIDVWRIEHELHRDPEEFLNDHLQGHGLQLPEGSLESHATEDYPPAPPEGKKHCPRCGGSGEIDKDIYGQSIGGIYECERCNGDGLVNESYAKEDFVHQAGYPPESASDKPYDWWEGQGEFMIDTTKDDLHQEIKMAGDRGVYDVSINNGLVGVDANAWELVKAKQELEREGKIKRGSRYDKMFEGGEWEPYGHKEPSEYWFDSSVNFGSESYAKEDSLVKIEDNNDDDTQVTVLDEWENETDPDVGGKTEDINATEDYTVDAGWTGQNSFTDSTSISKEEVTQSWWDNTASPHSKARVLKKTGHELENTFHIPKYNELPQETKSYLLGLDNFSFESKATEYEQTVEDQARDDWEHGNDTAKRIFVGMNGIVGDDSIDIIRRPFYQLPSYLQRQLIQNKEFNITESKATEFDYNKWENAEDGNVLVPDEDLKEIKDLEKQLDGENVCPECGDKTDDDKEFEDHLNAHRFEEEV